MALKNVSHMNPGNGETSYANNSGLQKAVIWKTLPMLDETLQEMFVDGFCNYKPAMKMVDLGCSSGPNTIFIISHILDSIQRFYEKANTENVCNFPQVEVFLNDLPDNDFNNLFKLLPTLSYHKVKCFVYGLPGSFYGRLFPSNTIHFAYSSYSLHWLSQIPEGLKKKNKENIYIARTSPHDVLEAYGKQYQRDLSKFLSSRAEEFVTNGRMVLTFIGRSLQDQASCENDYSILTLVSETLLDMVVEGFVKIDDLYSFNMPVYMPCYQEVERVIKKEGSFNLDKMQVFRVPWYAHDDDDDNNVVEEQDDVFLDKIRRGKMVASNVRGFMEPMLSSHFGSSILDQVFRRYAEKVAMHLTTKEGLYFTILISLRRI